jgi:hypothetical protein
MQFGLEGSQVRSTFTTKEDLIGPEGVIIDAAGGGL